jgi:hypothetical protein
LKRPGTGNLPQKNKIAIESTEKKVGKPKGVKIINNNNNALLVNKYNVHHGAGLSQTQNYTSETSASVKNGKISSMLNDFDKNRHFN